VYDHEFELVGTENVAGDIDYSYFSFLKHAAMGSPVQPRCNSFVTVFKNETSEKKTITNLACEISSIELIRSSHAQLLILVVLDD
jgi:hypothetical protein